MKSDSAAHLLTLFSLMFEAHFDFDVIKWATEQCATLSLSVCLSGNIKTGFNWREFLSWNKNILGVVNDTIILDHMFQ